MTIERHDIRYGFWKPLLSVLGMGPRYSWVEADEENIRVRMGWAFRATIARPSVIGVASTKDRWAGIGVHGWRGTWLVNGSVSGIVTLDIDPAARAFVMGFPVRLRTLHVSVADPDAVVRLLG